MFLFLLSVFTFFCILFQNILFWDCQHFSLDADWENCHLAKRIINMTRELLKRIEMGRVGNFCCPHLNVFYVKEKNKKALETAKNNIRNFLDNPEVFMQRVNIQRNRQVNICMEVC